MTSPTRTAPTPKIAVIAGAGSGIGRGCAHRLAADGYRLLLVGRTAEKLEAVAGEIADAGGSARTFAADVRDWNAMATLGGEMAPPGIDLLVNSAGGQFAVPSALLSRNGWQSVVDTNLCGSFFLCRHLYPALALRRGAVINVVADIWRKPAPTLVHSGAARAGVVSLTRTLALEWAPAGIRVNAVSPGLTETPALRDSYRSLVETVPLGRLGGVEEMVEGILFLARARYITGEVLTIDGGLHLV